MVQRDFLNSIAGLKDEVDSASSTFGSSFFSVLFITLDYNLGSYVYVDVIGMNSVGGLNTYGTNSLVLYSEISSFDGLNLVEDLKSVSVLL